MDTSEHAALNGLMARLAEGDRTAFDPALALVSPVVHRFTARALAGGADAPDVAQDALLKVLARASSYDASRDALPWILGIAAWECRTWRRKAGRRREAPEATLPIAQQTPSPEDDVIARDLHAAALDVLGGLPPKVQETLLASLGESTAPLGVTFRKRLSRALSRARAAWSTKHGQR